MPISLSDLFELQNSSAGQYQGSGRADIREQLFLELMDALDTFIREKPSGCLYHYTGIAGLIGIVQNRNLWASDYRHLNDRKEYRIGARLLHEEVRTSRLEDRQRNAFKKLVADTQKACFVLSFSERGDQLSQWRAYCPTGNGYALGFGQKNALFYSAEQHSFNLIRCEYDHRKQRKLCRYLVDSFMEGMVTRQSWWPENDMASRAKAFFERYQWNLALALVMAALKHSGFEEEKEWRLVSQYPDDALYGVSFRPGRFGVTPYFELPIGTEDSPRQSMRSPLVPRRIEPRPVPPYISCFRKTRRRLGPSSFHVRLFGNNVADV